MLSIDTRTLIQISDITTAVKELKYFFREDTPAGVMFSSLHSSSAFKIPGKCAATGWIAETRSDHREPD